MSTSESKIFNFSKEMEGILSRIDVLTGGMLSTDSSIARELDVARGNPAQWRKRGTTPFEALINYAKKKNINIHWLLTGEGEKELFHSSKFHKEQYENQVEYMYKGEEEAGYNVGENAAPSFNVMPAITMAIETQLKTLEVDDKEALKTLLYMGSLHHSCKQNHIDNAISAVNNLSMKINDNNNDDLAMIPGYNVQVSAGHGAINDNETPTRYLAFRKKWLQYRGFKPTDLVVVFTKGDSMEPTISNNDSLLIHTKVNSILDGKIYVIRQDETLLVKRVQRLLDGNIKLISDNKAYEPMVLNKESFESLDVVGQVVWIAKDIS